MSKSANVRKMTQTAMIAGIYAAVTFATFYMSFGAVQFRVSEALTILPVFTATAIPGLSIGCALANLVGFFVGVNPTGWMDALFGASATLLAAGLTWLVGRMKQKSLRLALAPLPPVLLNAVIVGWELTIAFGPAGFPFFLGYAASVAIGQAVICYGLGVPLMLLLERKGLYKKIFW